MCGTGVRPTARRLGDRIVTQPPPPPGWVPPGRAAARRAAPATAPAARSPARATAAGRGYGPPVHKPGVVALRPLGLGDFFDGAFKTIRRNPKAMVGLAALVTTAFMVVPVAGDRWSLAAAGHLDASTCGRDPVGEARRRSTACAVSLGELTSGSFFGLFATDRAQRHARPVVAEAVLGRRTTIGRGVARPPAAGCCRWSG